MNLSALVNNSSLLNQVKLGHAEAQHQWGQLALKERKLGVALRFFQLAAQQGHNAAQHELAALHKLLN